MFGRKKEPEMAEATKPDQAAPTDNQVYLTPNEVLGAIVRNLQEAIAYCMQDPRAVHPMVIMAYLDRGFGWAQKLPEPQVQEGVPSNGAGKQAEDGKRAN